MTAACPARLGTSVDGNFGSFPHPAKRLGGPRSAGGFRRPPACRIVPEGDGWVLELEPDRGGAWLGSDAHLVWRQTFASLMAAIAYALTRGWRYRVVHVASPPSVS